MASLKDIRKRIASVKNTQQITRAMKMVAAAKLRRAQETVTKARPYAMRLEGMLGDLAARSDTDGDAAHPLLASHDEKKNVELVVMTSDRGLCGGFNSNILRRAIRFVFENKDEYETIHISCVGRKGREFLKRRTGFEHGAYHEGILRDLRYQRAEDIAHDLSKRFIEGELDAVFLLYNRFFSALTQEVSLVQLLPIQPPEATSDEEALAQIDFLYEPSQQDVLGKLLPQHLSTQMWRALLESVASEHGSRMSSMDSATRNAGEMIDRLTLVANRTRQAAITSELMEIVSGAEALK